MNKIGTFEVSKLLKITENQVCILVKYCESFPKPDLIGKKFYHDSELIAEWMSTHNVKNERRYCYTKKNKELLIKNYQKHDKEKTNDKNLIVDIKNFLSCNNSPWRKLDSQRKNKNN
jgi:hypothetical protein